MQSLTALIGQQSAQVLCFAQDDKGSCELLSLNSAPTSALPSARIRRRYQSTIVTSENIKMMVETALISGVMPRRRRPQISRGSVLSRPIRKKLTAISSIESVKISSAAPMMGSFRFGTVIRQKVCQ